MTDLERAILHIKTRADAWAVKEVEKALSQEPCDAVSRDEAITAIRHAFSCVVRSNPSKEVREIFNKCKENLRELPSVTQKSGKCKNCTYFEYDSVAKVDGIPLEQIRAEIEKRIYEATLLEQKDGDVFYAGRNDGLQTAIDIIDKYR